MGFMVVSSMMVAVYSLRFAGAPFGHWGLIDRGIRDVITHVPDSLVNEPPMAKRRTGKAQ
jgi:hypothetical protein